VFKLHEIYSVDYQKIIKIVATRCQILRLKSSKFNFGWGSAPDPTWGAYSAPPDPLAEFEGPTSKGGDGREEGRGGDGRGGRRKEGRRERRTGREDDTSTSNSWIRHCSCLTFRLYSTSVPFPCWLPFLPRDAHSASAVLLSYVVRPSVCL